MRWCIGTVDVPGSPSAQGTASAFSHLANLMNASVFGVQDVLIPKYSCPLGVKCVEHDQLLSEMQADACDVAVMHEWRSPINMINHQSGVTTRTMMRVVNVHGGLNFATSWRNQSNFKPWVKFLVEDTAEAASLYEADHVVFPSYWMRNWTCAHQGFCDANRSSVVPNVIKLDESAVQVQLSSSGGGGDGSSSDSSSSSSGASSSGSGGAAATPASLLEDSASRPVKSFAYVGAVNDRKGIDLAVEAVCGLDVTLHVFGSLQRMEESASDASRYLNEAHDRCRARLQVYGPVTGSEVWPLLQRTEACLLNPSHLENQPTVVFEAAQYSVPMLALRIGPLEEMVANVDDIAADDAAHFSQRVAAVFAAGHHATPALHASVLTGREGWLAFAPKERARRRVVVSDTLLLPAGATNRDLLPKLAALPAATPLVLVLPSKEFIPNDGGEPLVVDTLAADAFAPSLVLNSSRLSVTLRVQPPFFMAEEADEKNYLHFPRGAPIVARPADLAAFASAFPTAAFRAWAFGVWMHSLRKPITSLAQVGTTYVPNCRETPTPTAEYARTMRISANCKIAADMLAQATEETPLASESCYNTATWQQMCLDGDVV